MRSRSIRPSSNHSSIALSASHACFQRKNLPSPHFHLHIRCQFQQSSSVPAPYSVFEKILFFIQELIISGMYMFYSVNILKPSGNVQVELVGRTITHLIDINTIIVVLDLLRDRRRLLRHPSALQSNPLQRQAQVGIPHTQLISQSHQKHWPTLR